MKKWQKAAAAAVLVAGALFAGSFLCPTEYEICGPNEYTHAKECAKHHAGPFVVLWIVGEIDGHNGLVTAIATVVMAIFTGTLYSVTGAAVRLARDEFNASHRPELIVREVAWGPQELAITFAVVNRGRNPGVVVESAFELRGREPDGRALPTEGLNAALAGVTLAAGEFRPVVYSFDAGEAFSAAGRTGHDCYFRGTIIYADRSNIRRRYVFSRVCSRHSDTFVSANSPENEYTD